MTYWLDLFTGKTWQEFLDAGATITGFTENRWRAVQRLEPGDRLLCYLTGVSRFIGVLEVTSKGFKDSKPIWSESEFPSRVNVRPLVTLTPETAIPVMNLKDKLTVFKDLKSPLAWTGHFRGSPARWKTEDGDVIYNALVHEKSNPIIRPFDPKKLIYRPKLIRSRIGAVTVPEPELDSVKSEVTSPTAAPASAHDQIQMLLAKLGSDLGLDVWIARNDRNRIVNGSRIGDGLAPRSVEIRQLSGGFIC